MFFVTNSVQRKYNIVKKNKDNCVASYTIMSHLISGCIESLLSGITIITHPLLLVTQIVITEEIQSKHYCMHKIFLTVKKTDQNKKQTPRRFLSERWIISFPNKIGFLLPEILCMIRLLYFSEKRL